MLAQDYMQELGYGNQPFLVYQHDDIARLHLHIVTVNVNENGVKIDDSFEKMKSMQICRELEKKYKLNQLPEDVLSDKLYLQKVDYSKANIKGQISNVVKSVLKEYTFQSLGELNALFSCYNIDMKHLKGESENKKYNGIVYSPTDDSGKIIGTSIKSSRISKEVGFNTISKIIEKHTVRIKEKGLGAHQLKNSILKSLKASNNQAQFISLMQKFSVDVVFRQNESNRIYGVTFIDHKNKVVCNGSRLGKEFSANIFNSHFSQEQDQDTPNISNDTSKYIKNDFHKSPSSLILVDEIFGNFSPGSMGFYAEEEEFIRKIKRKGKKVKRRI
ncbi:MULTISPECIES: relaxase/mobilization nuclease domain-containing protein [unclassified Dysgonomonas]|uniref:relaxase/mobilization nuclease domain-containing protein n=1 Tax=Dysgonomonas sp. PF1-16 TaxID=2940631 RepID=UPI0024765D2E|nr:MULTISPECIES: relaxase/mobilization nuclease domain-containing protein [unclassified Dysgonomonas]